MPRIKTKNRKKNSLSQEDKMALEALRHFDDILDVGTAIQ